MKDQGKDVPKLREVPVINEDGSSLNHCHTGSIRSVLKNAPKDILGGMVFRGMRLLFLIAAQFLRVQLKV